MNLDAFGFRQPNRGRFAINFNFEGARVQRRWPDSREL
jgi:hypothetical protein